jgi:hypothetical protein
MPVSPADFEFYSRVTGQPIPRDPAARMQMAPQVYAMRRGPLSGIKDRLGGAVRGAILGGAAVGAASLLLRDLNDGQSGEVNTPGENYGQKSVPHQTNVAKDIAETVKADEIATEGVDVTQANELASRQSVTPDYDDPSGMELVGGAASPAEVAAFRDSLSHQTAPATVAAPEVAPSTVREKTSDLIGRVFGTAEQAPSQLAQYGALNPQEQEIRDLMTAYESAEGQALAGQDQSISPFQVGGAMPSLMEQNKPVRELQKSMPGASKEEMISAMNAPAGPGGVRMQLPSTSGNPASVEFFPEARGEGGISAAKVQFRPGGETYTYEASPEGVARLQGVQSGAEKVKSGKSFLRDAISKGQLVNPVDALLKSESAPEPASEAAPVQAAAAEKVTLGDVGKQFTRAVGSTVQGLLGKAAARRKEQEVDAQIRQAHGNVTDPEQISQLRDYYMNK